MKSKTKSYIRTDLACESAGSLLGADKEERGFATLIRTSVKSEEEATRSGRAVGEYLTFAAKRFYDMDDHEAAGLSRLVARELQKMAKKVTGREIDENFSVLVACIGNAKMTPDAIGPETMSRLSVTGHVARLDPEAFSSFGSCKLFAVAPGVLGDTGIEASEIIRGALAAANADLVVAVDALASRSAERLAKTVQMSDAGISPGSGVGNKRKELSRKTLGVPVIALGVPTVIDTSTLVFDALSMLGAEENDEMRELLSSFESFFVAPRESDAEIRRAASVIADAIDLAFGINRAELEYN